MSPGVLTDIVVTAAVIPRLLWMLAAMMWISRNRDRVVRWLLHEIRPFVLPLIFIQYFAPVVIQGHVLTTGNMIGIGLALWNWLVCRKIGDDDDDRWKRRKAKVAEKVANIGGRLTVVPAGA